MFVGGRLVCPNRGTAGDGSSKTYCYV